MGAMSARSTIISKLRRDVFSHDSDDLKHIWSQQPGLIQFLDGQVQADEPVVLFAHVHDSEDRSIGHGRLRVWTVLVSERTLASIDTSSLHEWEHPHEFGMWRLWGDKDDPAAVSRDYFKLGDQPLTDGQPLVFPRNFEGREVDKEYCDVNQSLLHAHRLHWTPERQAWCRFNKAKDVEDVIKWYNDKDESNGSRCVTTDHETLDRYMTATNTVLIQMFDSALLPVPTAEGPVTDQIRDKIAIQMPRRYYRRTVATRGSRYYGIQIMTSRYSAKILGIKMDEERTPAKRYATFRIRTIEGEAEASCNPNYLSNLYEAPSGRPSELSPVFFSPHVLGKYKSDPDKYRVTPRQIYCRGDMLLQTYHINEANQVVTYLYYLGHLPYDEQLYWKSFNEEPKAGISEEAFCTDFKGKPFTGPDALRDLRHFVIRRLTHVEWYKTVSSDLLDQLTLPISGAKKEWNETIGLLNKIVNEPLVKSFFCRASGLQQTKTNRPWGSNRWMKEALKAYGESEERIRKITEPFYHLRDLRNRLYGHDSGPRKTQLYASLLKEHGSPRGHVEDLCTRLVKSLRHIHERWPGDGDTIGEIDRLKAELDDHRPLPPDTMERLTQKLRIEWSHHSNAIEGNTLTLGETRSLILHGLTVRGKPLRDHLDIGGHDDAVKAIEEAARGGDALNQAFIRNLHGILLKESYEMPTETPDGRRVMRRINVGKYKTTPNSVRTRTGEMYHFEPPEQAQPMMSDLIDWYRAKEAEGEHPIVVAATFHYRFVQIHPFDDGNGRMARLLMNLILMKHGYTIAMIQRDGRGRYIREIEQAQTSGSLAGFIAYIAECCRYSLALHLRAARGESIEEPEDIDREIALFKRSMTTASDGGERVDARSLVADAISPLYDYFRDKTESLTAYFSTRNIFGHLVTVGSDGKPQRTSLPFTGEPDEFPRNALSLRMEAYARLGGFRGSPRRVDIAVERSEAGIWRFELIGDDLEADQQIAIDHVGDDLDELKKCVDAVMRKLMAVLREWANRPPPEPPSVT